MITADSLIGTTLAGRYRVEARVGSGAMGAVYRAKQAGLGRCVALKIVNRDRQVDNATAQRFRREAKALSALHHPNTVRVFDFGATTGGLLYLAMELLEGEPLTDCLMRNGPLPLPQAITITQQVLRSIGEAHACGIVHRDLKPDNIFLARVQASPAPIVKVLDFGIAKAIDGTSKIDQFETLDGTVFGTPRYMSPEQAAGRALDPRSDLYSVGIMLYELIAGHPPFVDSDAVVVMARHIRDKPAPLSKAAGPGVQIPLSLETLVHKALAKQASARFQSAEEFERALARCATEIARQTKSPFARFLRDQSRVALGAAAALAVAAGGGGLMYALRRAPAAAEHADNAQPLATATAMASTTLNAAADPTSEPSPLPPPLPDTAPATDVARSVVSLQTAPPAAAVLQGGSALGVTPLDVSMNRGSSLTLLLRKKGFAEHRLELRADDRARIVTLRKLDERERDKERPSSSWRSRRERSRKGAPPAATSAASATPATPSATPSATSADKGSPYERF